MKLKHFLPSLFFLLVIAFPVTAQELPLNNKLDEATIDSLNKKRVVLYNQKNYAQLLLISFKLQQHYILCNDTVELQKIRLELADINRATRNYDKALNISESLLNEVPWSQKQFRANVYRLKSAIHYEAKNTTEAINEANTSIAISQEIKDHSNLRKSYNILGAIYRERNVDSSIYYLHKSLEYSSTNENLSDNALIYFNLSNAYSDKMEFDSVRKYGQISYKLATEAGIQLYQTMALNSLIKASKNNKELTKAMGYIELRDSIQGQNSDHLVSKEVNQIMNLIESKKNKEELEVVQENLKLTKELNTKKNIFLILAVIILIILSSMSIVIYRANIKNRQNIQRLKNLNKEVNKYSNNLASLNQTKDKILSVISHDLRSPFSQFITLLSFAKEGDINEEDYEQINDDLLLTAKNGLHMLDNLLYWAGNQVQGRKVAPATFNLLEIVGDVKDQLHYLASMKHIKIKIKCEFGLTLFADKVLYSIVIRNVLNNAIKFSPENEVINIEVINNSSHIKTIVSDKGCGVPNNVINSFNNDKLDYNSTPGTLGEKGAGMGLYLSKEFAQHTGGTLKFLQAEKGTKVEFSIPIT
ncbi:MAG: tetratricopeptide repeat-containing sensor histidine kinase [Salibacteraceae bacterium]